VRHIEKLLVQYLFSKVRNVNTAIRHLNTAVILSEDEQREDESKDLRLLLPLLSISLRLPCDRYGRMAYSNFTGARVRSPEGAY
jgi:hypothetical protein